MHHKCSILLPWPVSTRWRVFHWFPSKSFPSNMIPTGFFQYLSCISPGNTECSHHMASNDNAPNFCHRLIVLTLRCESKCGWQFCLGSVHSSLLCFYDLMSLATSYVSEFVNFMYFYSLNWGHWALLLRVVYKSFTLHPTLRRHHLHFLWWILQAWFQLCLKMLPWIHSCRPLNFKR